jgi:hypothetical protein
MKMAVFWVVAPCSLVEVYRRFRRLQTFYHQKIIALMMEAASTSETPVNFYQTTRHNNPEEIHLQTMGCFKNRLFLFYIIVNELSLGHFGCMIPVQRLRSPGAFTSYGCAAQMGRRKSGE